MITAVGILNLEPRHFKTVHFYCRLKNDIQGSAIFSTFYFYLLHIAAVLYYFQDYYMHIQLLFSPTGLVGWLFGLKVFNPWGSLRFTYWAKVKRSWNAPDLIPIFAPHLVSALVGCPGEVHPVPHYTWVNNGQKFCKYLKTVSSTLEIS